ncbi:MAG: CvpA family protein [Betaproteobacteria bacterium]|nr:CvpA family protein [Betaproteobacteria bacterium]
MIDSLNNFGAFDALVAVVILVSCGFGAVHGFTAMVFTKLSILAGIWFAFFRGDPVVGMLEQLGIGQPVAGFAAPALIVFLAGLTGWLIASSVVRVLKTVKLGFINNLLGGCYGFLRIAVLILAGTAAAAHLDALDKEFYESSKIMQASGWTLYKIGESETAPAPIREFLESFRYDKDTYRPALSIPTPAIGKGIKASRKTPPPPLPKDEAEAIKMIEQSTALKKISDTIAGRNNEQAAPDQETETERQNRRRQRRMTDEEILAEELEALKSMDEKALENLLKEDEELSKYLERFKQQIPDAEQLQSDSR